MGDTRASLHTLSIAVLDDVADRMRKQPKDYFGCIISLRRKNKKFSTRYRTTIVKFDNSTNWSTTIKQIQEIHEEHFQKDHILNELKFWGNYTYLGNLGNSRKFGVLRVNTIGSTLCHELSRQFLGIPGIEKTSSPDIPLRRTLAITVTPSKCEEAIISRRIDKMDYSTSASEATTYPSPRNVKYASSGPLGWDSGEKTGQSFSPEVPRKRCRTEPESRPSSQSSDGFDIIDDIDISHQRNNLLIQKIKLLEEKSEEDKKAALNEKEIEFQERLRTLRAESKDNEMNIKKKLESQLLQSFKEKKKVEDKIKLMETTRKTLIRRYEDDKKSALNEKTDKDIQVKDLKEKVVLIEKDALENKNMLENENNMLKNEKNQLRTEIKGLLFERANSTCKMQTEIAKLKEEKRLLIIKAKETTNKYQEAKKLAKSERQTEIKELELTQNNRIKDLEKKVALVEEEKTDALDKKNVLEKIRNHLEKNIDALTNEHSEIMKYKEEMEAKSRSHKSQNTDPDWAIKTSKERSKDGNEKLTAELDHQVKENKALKKSLTEALVKQGLLRQLCNGIDVSNSNYAVLLKISESTENSN